MGVVGAGGVSELGSGAEHTEDGLEQEGGASGPIELGALRACVEAGLHSVDVRLDQQADMLAQMQGMPQVAACRSAGRAGGHRRGAR